MQHKVILIGAGGQAKVIADIIIKNKDFLLGFLDDNKEKNTNIISDYKVIGKFDDCIEMQNKNPEIEFIIAIGDNRDRMKIAQKYNLSYYTAVHPNAAIGMNAKIKEGTVIMANAVVNSNASIGRHCIINTGVVVEHDNQIGDFVHLSPNSTLTGNVRVGCCTHIGAGATVRNNINIGSDIVIGAGAVVVKDIEEPGIYVGVPARKLER